MTKSILNNCKPIALLMLTCIFQVSVTRSQNMPGTANGFTGIGQLAAGWSNNSSGGGTPDLSNCNYCILPMGLWNLSPTDLTAIILPVPPTGASIFADVYTAYEGYIEGIRTTITGLIPGNNYTVQVYLLSAISKFASVPPGYPDPIYFPTSVEITINGNIMVAQLDSTTNNNWKLFTFPFTANATTASFAIGNPKPHNPVMYGYGGGVVCISIGDNAISCSNKINLGNDKTLCNGDTLMLNAGTPNAIYLWQDSSVDSTYNVFGAGTYTVTVHEQNCYSSDTINIYYNPVPVINLGNDSTLCIGKKMILDASTSNASYTWQDNSSYPQYPITSEGTYWVKVTVDGCMNEDTITIKFTDCNCLLSIPNAITPNGDGINDKWVLSNPGCFRQVDVFVYNRYGSLVYEKYNYQNNWEGTYKLKTIPDGTYYYVIKVIRTNRHEQVLRGNITILR